MMRGALIVSTLVSVIFFPWPFTVLLAFAAAFTEPLMPLAAGLFADTLYYAPLGHVVPLATLAGAVVTLMALFVRSQLRTGIIKR